MKNEGSGDRAAGRLCQLCGCSLLELPGVILAEFSIEFCLVVVAVVLVGGGSRYSRLWRKMSFSSKIVVRSCRHHMTMLSNCIHAWGCLLGVFNSKLHTISDGFGLLESIRTKFLDHLKMEARLDWIWTFFIELVKLDR